MTNILDFIGFTLAIYRTAKKIWKKEEAGYTSKLRNERAANIARIIDGDSDAPSS
jgi:hypothetical protein